MFQYDLPSAQKQNCKYKTLTFPLIVIFLPCIDSEYPKYLWIKTKCEHHYMPQLKLSCLECITIAVCTYDQNSFKWTH